MNLSSRADPECGGTAGHDGDDRPDCKEAQTGPALAPTDNTGTQLPHPITKTRLAHRISLAQGRGIRGVSNVGAIGKVCWPIGSGSRPWPDLREDSGDWARDISRRASQHEGNERAEPRRVLGRALVLLVQLPHIAD